MFWVYVFFVGLAVGWMAGQVVRGRGFGLTGNLIIGIAGSFIGGMILRTTDITGYGLVGAVVSAFVGAVILLLILNLIKK